MTEADFEFDGTEGNESIRLDQQQDGGFNFMQP